MFPGLKVKSRVGLLLLLLSFIEEVSGWGCFIGFWNVNLPVITEVFFPLRSMEAEVLIVDGIADVKFKQWFDVVPNPPDTSFPDDWKTKYVIPIPDAGAIYAFQGSYEVGGVLRVVEGEVKGKEQAEQEFNDAVESGKPAFLGEESDAGEFLIQFGNVPLNVEVVIELRYAIEVEVLDREKFRWVFPQGLAPTMDAFVGTAAEIASLPYDNGAFNLFLTACSSSGSITASSPSHSTMVTGTSTSECKDLSLRDTAQDRKDIILLFETLKVQDVQADVFEEVLGDGSRAYMLSLLPDTSSFTGIVSPSIELIFVVDRSGSMRGDKIIQTADALREVYDRLPEGTLVNFIGFGTTFQVLFAQSENVDSAVTDARVTSYLTQLDSDYGGTDLYTPLEYILSRPATAGYDRSVLVLTDGDVFGDETRIIDYVSSNRASTRVFTLGIGEGVDRETIDGIARAGGGTAEYVDTSDLADIQSLAQRQVDIVTQAGFLGGFNVEWRTSANGVEAPYDIKTVFADRRTLIYYLTDDALSSVFISAFVGGQVSVSYEVPQAQFRSPSSLLPPTGTLGGLTKAVSVMGAKKAIQDLEEDRSILHDTEGPVDLVAVKNEIVRIGVKYQITSSETSFIAVDNMGWQSRNAEPGPGNESPGGSPPVAAPTPAVPPAICFSGENRVLVEGRGYIRMDRLKIGDMVQVGNNEYSRLYSFGHLERNNRAEYLQIYATGLEDPLEISPDHMVFVDKVGAVPASAVQVGLNLVAASSGGFATVTKIDVVRRSGAFAPFTESGTVIVSGVLASSYVSMSGSDAFEVCGLKFVSMHWLAHAFQAPHRMVCKWNMSFCDNEGYSDEGVSYWVYRPHLAAKWLLEQHGVLWLIMSFPVTLLGASFFLIEKVSSSAGLLFLTVSSAIVLPYRAKKKGI